MNTMRKTLTLAAPILTLILIAALTTTTVLHHTNHHDQATAPDTTPTTTAPTTTTTPTPHATDPDAARGPAASTLDLDTTDLERRAAAFVIAAATPDSRLDTTPTAAWKRASTWATPTLAHELATQKDTAADQWWRDMSAHDGWVSIRVTNILDGHPQAPGAADHTDDDTLDVIFLTTWHTTENGHDKTIDDQHPHTWTLHLTGTRINEFDPDAQN